MGLTRQERQDRLWASAMRTRDITTKHFKKEKPMPKFKVYATMTTYLSKVIEAVDENDALEQAEAIDGGEFTEDNPMAGGWDITHAEPVKQKRVRK